MIVRYVRADQIPIGARVLLTTGQWATVTDTEPAAMPGGTVTLRLDGYSSLVLKGDHKRRCDLTAVPTPVDRQLADAARKLAACIQAQRGAGLEGLEPDVDAGLDATSLTALFGGRR